VTHCSSSGAPNCICSLWFIYFNNIKDFVYIIHSPYYNINIKLWAMYNIYEIFYLIAVYKPEAANTVWSS
jgi:hypothetical protein